VGGELYDGRESGGMTTLEKAVFVLACALFAMLTAVVETSFFHSFRPFGYAPDLCLALSVATGLKFGAKCGGIVGVMAGFFVDSFADVGLSLSVLLYFAIGVVAGIVSAMEAGRGLNGFLMFLGSMVAAIGAGSMLTLIIECILHFDMSILAVISRTVAESICTFVFAPAVYLPVALLCGAVKRRTQGASIRNRK
jgi:hypothetical protein